MADDTKRLPLPPVPGDPKWANDMRARGVKVTICERKPGYQPRAPMLVCDNIARAYYRDGIDPTIYRRMDDGDN